MFFPQKSEKLVRVVIISLIFTMFPSISLIAGDKAKCPCKYKAEMIIGMAKAFDNSECFTGGAYTGCDPLDPPGGNSCVITANLWNDPFNDDENLWFEATNGGYIECMMEIFTNRAQNISDLSVIEVEACIDEIINACDVIDPDWY